MSTGNALSCDKVQTLTSGITCLSNTGDCNVFTDSCLWKCASTEYSTFLSTESTWDSCLRYSRVLSHVEVSEKSTYTVSFVDSPQRKRLDPVWNDTALATCMTELWHKSSGSLAANNDTLLKCSEQTLLSEAGIISTNAARECRAALCADNIINEDIAGVGIYISYIFQVTIFLVLILSWTFFHNRMRIIGYVLYTYAFFLFLCLPWVGLCRILTGRSFTLPSLSKLIISTNSLALSKERSENAEWAKRASAAIVKLATSFHKAQCFFALALAGTSWHFMTTKADALKDIDQRALATVVGSGIYPLTCMLLFLDLLHPGQVSWAMLAASIVTWLLSILVSYYAVGVAADYRSEQRSIPVCGGKSLSDFCARSEINYIRYLYLFTAPLIAICVAARLSQRVRRLLKKFVILVIMEPDQPPRQSTQDKLDSTENASPSPESDALRESTPSEAQGTTGTWDSLSNCLSWILAKLVFAVMLLLVFVAYACWKIVSMLVLMSLTLLPAVLFIVWFAYLTSGFKDHLSQTWTFGQIVALMIWLPIIAEGIEYCWHGMLYLYPAPRIWLLSHREKSRKRRSNGSGEHLLPLHIQDAKDATTGSGEPLQGPSAEPSPEKGATTSTVTEAVRDGDDANADTSNETEGLLPVMPLKTRHTT